MTPTRRDVIRTLAVCGTCGALGLCPGALFADDGPTKGWTDLAAVADFDADGIFDKFAKSRRLLIIRKGDKLIACSSMCTHKNAPLSRKDDHMRCAKHGSEFDAEGIILKGPAKTSLPRCAIKIENDRVFVNTSKIFEERDWGEAEASATIKKSN